MVIKAAKFTPEILIGSPRRSTGQPSPCGEYILHTISRYDFNEHKRNSEIRVLEQRTGSSHLIVGESKGSEAHWLPGNQIVYLRKECNGDSGRTELVQTNIKGKDIGVIGLAGGRVQGLKLKVLDDGDVLLVAWGRADSEGNLVNEKNQQRPHHTSRLYSSLMVRHWDQWKDKYHNALFFAHMKAAKACAGKPGWTLSDWTSVHKGTPLESPRARDVSSSQYDISGHGIAFISNDPHVNPATHTRSNCYYVPILSKDRHCFEISLSGLTEIETQGLRGAASNPVFSPDGDSLVFLKMEVDGAASDQNRIILVTGMGKSSLSLATVKSIKLKDNEYDITPSKICFGHNANTLFMLAELNGLVRVWLFESDTGTIEPMTRSGSISDFQCLYDPPRLFLSGSNLVDDSFYSVLWPSNPRDPELISSHSRNGELYGLSHSQSTSFWYVGKESNIHCLMFTPSGFNFDDKSKKWPLALLIHGGPDAAWIDAWSTRWNPAVWAEQGYVVVMPNITGSTGYGKEFCDASRLDWGGVPYEDLVILMDHIKEHMQFVDLDKAIAAGASYGGFMVNWIQGQDLGRQFKALVCHDGVFNQFGAQISTEELDGPLEFFGGAPWEQKEFRKAWDKWDPSAYIHNWATPQLVIHNESDFRLSIAEGIGAFNALQTKGVPSRLLVGKDESHWTLGEENSLVWHTVVLNWINKYVGLPPCREDEEKVIELDEPFSHH